MTKYKPYQILREAFLSTSPVYDDVVIDAVDFGDEVSLLFYCQFMFTSNKAPVMFPAKSYNVAVIYATLLVHHFGGLVEEYLDDPSLLLNDRYFKPYSERKVEYDWLIAKYGDYNTLICSEILSVQKTIEYFNQEFLIGSELYHHIKCTNLYVGSGSP